DLANAKLVGDLLVHQPSADHHHYLAFSRRKGGHQGTDVICLGRCFDIFGTSRQSDRDSIEQDVFPKGLLYEIRSSGLKGLHRNGNITMTRNEYDRDFTTLPFEVILEFKA